MAEFNLDNIPRGTRPGANKDDRLVIIKAEFAKHTIMGGNVRPGSIEARWGVMVGRPTMQTLFRGEVVYDSPQIALPSAKFPDRNSPHYATFDRYDLAVVERQVPGGALYLLQQTFDETRPVFEDTESEGSPPPPEDADYCAFQALIAAGETDPSAPWSFVETEAAATIGALARVLAPSVPDAQWVLRNLLPSGELPGSHCQKAAQE